MLHLLIFGVVLLVSMPDYRMSVYVSNSENIAGGLLSSKKKKSYDLFRL